MTTPTNIEIAIDSNQTQPKMGPSSFEVQYLKQLHDEIEFF